MFIKKNCSHKHKYQLVKWFHKLTNEPLYYVRQRSKKQLYFFYYNSQILKKELNIIVKQPRK